MRFGVTGPQLLAANALESNLPNQQVNNVLYVSLPETGDYMTPAILPEGPALDFTITFVVQ